MHTLSYIVVVITTIYVAPMLATYFYAIRIGCFAGLSSVFTAQSHLKSVFITIGRLQLLRERGFKMEFERGDTVSVSVIKPKQRT